MNRSHHQRYRGRSIGRILHFLEHYLPYHMAEHVQVGNDRVEFRGSLVATITWSTKFGEGDVPIFKFVERAHTDERSGDTCEELEAMQTERQKDAINDAIKYNEVTEREPLANAKTVLCAINRTIWQEMHLMAQLRDTNAEFFTGNGGYGTATGKDQSLFCKVGKSTYLWDRDRYSAAGWLLYAEDAS